MALTPAEDKTAFWKRLRHDPWLEKSFALTGKSDAQAAKKIRKNRVINDTELKGDVRFCLIFDAPSMELDGPYETSCIQVDMLVPLSAQDWADSRLSQVIALCGKNWSVNGRAIAKVVRVAELSATPGFYRCGARFYYYSCTENQIKKI